MTTWDSRRVATFLTTAETMTRYAPIFTLAILTGLRHGELLAIRGRDVDFDRAILTVPTHTPSQACRVTPPYG